MLEAAVVRGGSGHTTNTHFIVQSAVGSTTSTRRARDRAVQGERQGGRERHIGADSPTGAAAACANVVLEVASGVRGTEEGEVGRGVEVGEGEEELVGELHRLDAVVRMLRFDFKCFLAQRKSLLAQDTSDMVC